MINDITFYLYITFGVLQLDSLHLAYKSCVSLVSYLSIYFWMLLINW